MKSSNIVKKQDWNGGKYSNTYKKVKIEVENVWEGSTQNL